MSKHINIFAICLITMSAAVGMAQYEDRFDGTTSSNWVRESLLDHGSAEWSISGGKMNFFTGSSPTSDNQVLIKYQNPFSNSQDWSFRIGMNNASTAQLQVFVGNFDYTDCFGVTLKGYADGSKIWGAEYPGPNYWMPGGITASASQQGSIKVDYKASSGIYSLLYANGGVDPISNNYSYNLLNSYASPEKGNVSLYIGMNTSEGVGSGQAYVDNFNTVPEPSSTLLLSLGLGCLFCVKRFLREKDKKAIWLFILTGISLYNNEARSTTYFTISPNLSHQLVEVTSPFVPYSYKISQNMTTSSDWLVFLNNKAKTSDPYGLFKTSDFSRALSNGEYSYSLLNSTAGNQPIRGINLYDAYRYANWIENGASSNSDTETGSYNLLGLNINNNNLANRSGSAHFFIQTVNEWQRSLDVINTNVGYDEWTDSYSIYDNGAYIVHNDVPAGLSSQISFYADKPERALGFGGADLSFRIVSVPEPSALSLLAVGLGGWAMMRRRRS